MAWFTSVNVKDCAAPDRDSPRHARSTRSTCFLLSSVVATYLDRLRGLDRLLLLLLLLLLPTGASIPSVRELRNDDEEDGVGDDDGARWLPYMWRAGHIERRPPNAASRGQLDSPRNSKAATRMLQCPVP